jgi:hypothetical protein
MRGGLVTGKVEITHNYFPQMGPELRREADRLAGATAFSILGHAQVAMAAPKHGKTYARGNRTHIASAPREAPAIDTGVLTASGYAKRLQFGTWEAGFTTQYAAALEYGTPRIEPRPYLRPAVEAHRDGFMAAIRRLVGA